jgi:DNA-directed RNA polymerase
METATPKREQPAAEEPSLLQRIRNSWEFASLMQYIFFFGKIMKIDEDLGVEVFFLLSDWVDLYAYIVLV